MSKQVIGAAERGFGVDDPLFLSQRLQEGEKQLPVGQICELARAGHAQQFRGKSPPANLMEVKA